MTDRVSVTCQHDGQVEYTDRVKAETIQSHGMAVVTFCGSCGRKLVFPRTVPTIRKDGRWSDDDMD